MRMDVVSRPGFPPVLVGSYKAMSALAGVAMDASGQRLVIDLGDGKPSHMLGVSTDVALAFSEAGTVFLVGLSGKDVAAAWRMSLTAPHDRHLLEEAEIGAVADMLSDHEFLVTNAGITE